MLNVLDLFSGTGQLGLAFQQALARAGLESRTVAYCESERYAQGILLSRQLRAEIDVAPIASDVRDLSAAGLCRALGPVGIDAIVAGFPCQDISWSGLGAGLGGKRSVFFFEVLRLAGELGRPLVALENVPAILVRGGGSIAGEFAALGYDLRWKIMGADEVGATHQRKRWWCLAYAAKERRGQIQRPTPRQERHADQQDEGVGDVGRSGRDGDQRGRPGKKPSDGLSKLADAKGPGQSRNWPIGFSETDFELPSRPPRPGDADSWAKVLQHRPDLEPALCGVAPRVAHRTNRIRACGNGVDFPCAVEAFTELLKGVWF